MKKILIFVLLLPSCNNFGGGHSTLPRDEFVQIYAEILSLEGKTPSVLPDSVRKNINKSNVDSLLKSHGVKKEEFLATVDELNRKPEVWKVVFDSVFVSIGDIQKRKNATH